MRPVLSPCAGPFSQLTLRDNQTTNAVNALINKNVYTDFDLRILIISNLS